MSIFDWFTKKPVTPAIHAPESSGLGHDDATQPLHHARMGSADANHAVNRRTERLEKRDLLYSVVRESMNLAGVLSTSYKFKVLSLDSRGRQYLIMMDLDRKHVGEPGHLAEIEALIAKNAKVRHDIVVTSVYWRVIEQVTTGLVAPVSPVTGHATLSEDVASQANKASTAVAGGTKPRFEPLQQDEVAAFKAALSSASNAPRPQVSGELIKSGRRNPNPQPVFQDTQLDDSHSPLSATQYGDLN